MTEEDLKHGLAGLKTVILKRLTFDLHEDITDLVRNASFDLMTFLSLHFGPRMVLRVQSYALSETAWEACYYYPADWWQAFRERWFPSRWLRRWPVKKKAVAFEIARIYPWLNYSIQEAESRLVFRQYTMETQPDEYTQERVSDEL